MLICEHKSKIFILVVELIFATKVACFAIVQTIQAPQSGSGLDFQHGLNRCATTCTRKRPLYFFNIFFSSAGFDRGFDRMVNARAPVSSVGQGGFPKAPKSWRSSIDVSTEASKALVLSDKRSTLREIFSMELRLAAELIEIEWGLWESDHLLPHHVLARLASTRAQIKVLAGSA